MEEFTPLDPLVAPPYNLIAERLFRARTVIISGEITQRVAAGVTAQLLALAGESSEEITVFINSQGGHVEAGDTIHDLVRFLSPRVRMVGTGWVAPSSPRCWAVSSSDVAPVMVALGADYVLVGPGGERVVPAARFYHNDGINYLTKQPDEVLAAVRLPAPDGWDAVYHKLRRRGSFDFPVLGVAAWTKWERGAGSGERVVEARIVLGGVASWPQEIPEAGAALAGTDLSDEAIAAAADAAYRPAKPMDNTDFDLSWRKQMTRVYVARALAELRQRRRAAK